jgi:hypothetical protein
LARRYGSLTPEATSRNEDRHRLIFAFRDLPRLEEMLRADLDAVQRVRRMIREGERDA